MTIDCAHDQGMFEKHMEEKLSLWKCKEMEIGVDFAIFTFEYKYERVNAKLAMEKYAPYCGYNLYGKENKLVVINKTVD